MKRSLGMICAAALALASVASCDVETAARNAIIALFYRQEAKPPPADAVAVQAVAETEPVLDGSDAADDPAIWLDPDVPGRGWLLGTNKRRGIEVYDLTGARRWRLDAGRVNNVDLRSGVVVSGKEKVVVGATNRTTGHIDVWALDPATGELADLLAAPLPSGMGDPYGFCLYRSPLDDSLYAVATAKEGGARQWRLEDAGAATLRGELVRSIATDSQPEGCVADDANRTLFIGEEDVGIWRFGAEPSDPAAERRLIASVRPSAEAEAPIIGSPHRLTADVEGLAIYSPPGEGPDAGYLIASSQGNWTYVVFDRAPPHRYRGTFQVLDGDIDGAGETDGLDVVAAAAGPAYPQGLLVVQDGYNLTADGDNAYQNFKLISWADVAAGLRLEVGLGARQP